jgi:hypothetical protein
MDIDQQTIVSKAETKTQRVRDILKDLDIDPNLENSHKTVKWTDETTAKVLVRGPQSEILHYKEVHHKFLTQYFGVECTFAHDYPSDENPGLYLFEGIYSLANISVETDEESGDEGSLDPEEAYDF